MEPSLEDAQKAAVRLRQQIISKLQVEAVAVGRDEFLVFYKGALPERGLPIEWSVYPQEFHPRYKVSYTKGRFMTAKEVKEDHGSKNN